jgi:uncharacterized protein YkwD
MKRKLYTTLIAGLLTVTAIFGSTAAYAANALTIPDNYAAILDLANLKWSDTDSTGHKAGTVVEKEIDDIGTLVCYYVSDDYKADAVISRETDKGTFYFAIGYAPGGPAEYKSHKAALLCEPDSAPDDPALTVQDLQEKFATAATATPTTTAATPKPTPTAPASTAEPAKTYTDAEFTAEVIRLINEEREKAGAEPLEQDDKLCEIAGLKAKEMVDLKYFSHTSPNYGNPRMFAKHYGYENYSGVGENLCRAVTTNPAEIFNVWMKSAGHRKTMLNPAYTKAGLGRDSNLFFALELAMN